MPYTHTTYAALRTALANRLGDPGKVYFVDAELALYVTETLRMWGLLTGYWRDTGILATQTGIPFYDIQTIQNIGGDSLLSYSLTDQDIITRCQYHLLEPATGSSWTGSEQFTLTDFTDSLTRRRDQLLIETGAVVTHVTQAIGAGRQTFDLPDTTLQVRRIAWLDSTGTAYPLYPEDINSQRSYSTSFLTTPDTPVTYSSASAKPLRYIIAPPPNQNGTLDMLLVKSGATLNATGVALGIPDSMAWILKWGVLADILGKEGPGQDLPRSYFCERRWKLGIEVAKMSPVVINAQINGIHTSPDSVSQLDVYSPQWQSATNTPEFVISLHNIIGLAPCPDNIYSVLLDMVCKAPIPTLDTDPIQIGREYLNAILDYAEHLAAFKSGGYEFRHTYRAADNFFQAALSYNQRLAAQNPAIKTLIQQSTEDDYILRRERMVDNKPLQQLTQISSESATLKQLYQQ